MVESTCLCGDVAWQNDGPLELMAHCHCSMCRKSHGSAFGTYASTPEAGFRWVRGHDLVRQFESSPGNRRPFCSVCGSVVAGEPHDGRVSMPVGNVLEDPGSRPLVHIFAASKAPWYAISDDLPQFDAFPPGFDEPSFESPATSASRDDALRGSCLCGDVVYEVSGELTGVVLCHCSRCRRSRSAAHGANLFIADATIDWISGREQVRTYRLPGAKRFGSHFCERCGSLMPGPNSDPRLLVVPTGALDGMAPGVVAKVHIFTDSKAPWYEIHGDLPQTPGPPGNRRF